MRQGIGNKEEARGGTKRQTIALDWEKNKNEETDRSEFSDTGLCQLELHFRCTG